MTRPTQQAVNDALDYADGEDSGLFHHVLAAEVLALREELADRKRGHDDLRAYMRTQEREIAKLREELAAARDFASPPGYSTEAVDALATYYSGCEDGLDTEYFYKLMDGVILSRTPPLKASEGGGS